LAEIEPQLYRTSPTDNLPDDIDGAEFSFESPSSKLISVDQSPLLPPNDFTFDEDEEESDNELSCIYVAEEVMFSAILIDDAAKIKSLVQAHGPRLLSCKDRNGWTPLTKV